MINYRYVRRSETEQVRWLWGEAFGREEPYYSWYFREMFRPERTLAAFDGREMLACLQLNPYSISLAGQSLPVLYVVGVTTHPLYRRQGLGHGLLRHTLRLFEDSPFQLALLNTDVPRFYEPLGFTCCYSLRQLSFPSRPSPLPPSWRPIEPEQAAALLNPIYLGMCAGRDGYVQRSPLNWLNFCRDLRCDAGGAIHVSSNAYLLSWMRQDSLMLREVGYIDRPSLRQALDAAGALATAAGCSHFCWDAPLNAPTPPQRNEKLLPYVLARRLDIPADLEGEEAAAATRSLLRVPRPDLWVSEIT